VRPHDPAFDLQRRRDLVLLGAEVAREDREALDLLVARAVGVHLVDDRLDTPADGRRIDALRLLGIDRDQRHDVGPLVSDDESLRDDRGGLERVLEVLRGDILAACRDEDVLLAVGDVDEAVLVDRAHIP
jgi:hypothetical protein